MMNLGFLISLSVGAALVWSSMDGCMVSDEVEEDGGVVLARSASSDAAITIGDNKSHQLYDFFFKLVLYVLTLFQVVVLHVRILIKLLVELFIPHDHSDFFTQRFRDRRVGFQ